MGSRTLRLDIKSELQAGQESDTSFPGGDGLCERSSQGQERRWHGGLAATPRAGQGARCELMRSREGGPRAGQPGGWAGRFRKALRRGGEETGRDREWCPAGQRRERVQEQEGGFLRCAGCGEGSTGIPRSLTRALRRSRCRFTDPGPAPAALRLLAQSAPRTEQAPARRACFWSGPHALEPLLGVSGGTLRPRGAGRCGWGQPLPKVSPEVKSVVFCRCQGPVQPLRGRDPAGEGLRHPRGLHQAEVPGSTGQVRLRAALAAGPVWTAARRDLVEGHGNVGSGSGGRVSLTAAAPEPDAPLTKRLRPEALDKQASE